MFSDVILWCKVVDSGDGFEYILWNLSELEWYKDGDFCLFRLINPLYTSHITLPKDGADESR